MTETALLLKHVCLLSKNIASLSDGQAVLLEAEEGSANEDDLSSVLVSIIPRSGPYRGGRFDFAVDVADSYPTCPPTVRALTKMYHPNVELAGAEDEEDGSVCINLLDELWTSQMTLEDVVQGLLFLLYQPNLEDPLSSLFCGSEDEDEFLLNVRRSLRGGVVTEERFERNLELGYDSECEEGEENEAAPGDSSSNAPALGVLVETEETQTVCSGTGTSTMNVIAESSENITGDSPRHQRIHDAVPLPPPLPTLQPSLTNTPTVLETSVDKENSSRLFSQRNTSLSAFDKMWTLSLNSTLRTIVLGAQRTPLARLDSSSVDVR